VGNDWQLIKLDCHVYNLVLLFGALRRENKPEGLSRETILYIVNKGNRLQDNGWCGGMEWCMEKVRY